MSALLEIEDLHVHFDGVVAVDGVSMSVADGELLGLIGPNGAGKTTVLRAITGVVDPQAGSVRLAGHELKGRRTHQRVRLGLGFSQQLVRPFRTMSVKDNVALAAGHPITRAPLHALGHTRRDAARSRALELLGLVGIADAADAMPATLPLGYLKRLEVARALALEPRLLLLDEPLAGLNQREARALADTIAELGRNGLTIVLIEHNLAEVMRVCGRLVVLENGRPIGAGAPLEVMADAQVRAAYLGVDDAEAR